MLLLTLTLKEHIFNVFYGGSLKFVCCLCDYRCSENHVSQASTEDILKIFHILRIEDIDDAMPLFLSKEMSLQVLCVNKLILMEEFVLCVTFPEDFFFFCFM